MLGFWGGVGSMGTLFLVILLAQKYCCRLREDKDDAGGQMPHHHDTVTSG